jgi:hypothetical protein
MPFSVVFLAGTLLIGCSNPTAGKDGFAPGKDGPPFFAVRILSHFGRKNENNRDKKLFLKIIHPN